MAAAGAGDEPGPGAYGPSLTESWLTASQPSEISVPPFGSGIARQAQVIQIFFASLPVYDMQPCFQTSNPYPKAPTPPLEPGAAAAIGSMSATHPQCPPSFSPRGLTSIQSQGSLGPLPPLPGSLPDPHPSLTFLTEPFSLTPACFCPIRLTPCLPSPPSLPSSPACDVVHAQLLSH